MTKKLKLILIVVIGILISGCQKQPKEIISRIEISSQADIDFVCANLPDSDTFIGNIVIDTDQQLDYKCLTQIKHIQGALLLTGPGTTVPFRNIETITNSEVFAVCDMAVDTMSFPKLRIIETGISISSFCDFTNVLYIPNVEKLVNISVGSPSEGILRSGTFSGFNKIEEMGDLWFDTSNGLPDNFKIDGFNNLKKILGEFKFNVLNSNFQISENSFNNLEEINNLRIDQSLDSGADFDLEYILPNLKLSSKIVIHNIPPEQACYLSNHIESSDIESILILNTITSVFYLDEQLVEFCE